MLEGFKSDSKNQTENHAVMTGNLRMQLEETREMVSKVKETKEREFRKLREKCDEDIRRETDKYQFQYDKLREEIQMFQRKLSQEENVNVEFSKLNSRLNNVLGDLRNQYKSEVDEEATDIMTGVATHYGGAAPMNAAIDDKEILDRKKAWAELEREQTEVKRNIKSLMKFEPGSRVIDDPALAQRVSGVRMNPQNYDTAEDRVLEKQMNDRAGVGSAKIASPRATADEYGMNKQNSSEKRGAAN